MLGQKEGWGLWQTGEHRNPKGTTADQLWTDAAMWLGAHCCQILQTFQEKPEIQICQTSRFVELSSHFYKCCINQTKHTCQQHPTMTLTYYEAKDTRKEASCFAKPLTCEPIQGFSALASKNPRPPWCRWWLKGASAGWPQTSHNDLQLLSLSMAKPPHRDAVGMMGVMPINWQAQHR